MYWIFEKKKKNKVRIIIHALFYRVVISRQHNRPIKFPEHF